MTVKNIPVPLDGSGLAERALPYAAELARTIGASLTLVRTSDAPALLAKLECRQPDLVVMSTHGRSGIDRLVHGSAAHDVVSHVECPVMLVRADPENDTPAGPRLAGKRVLVPLDGSSFAASALPLAY